MQGEPLRWFSMRASPPVAIGQKCRLPSSEAQVICRPHCAVVPLCARKRELEQLRRTTIAVTRKILDLVMVAFHGCVVCCELMQPGQHIVLFRRLQVRIRA
jgi:hypothetical protein